MSDFKIIMCAPSGIGKTTLIASIFEEMRKCFAGTPITVEPVGKTEKRIHDKIDQMNSFFQSDDFSPESIRQTPDATDYTLDFILLKHKIQKDLIDGVTRRESANDQIRMNRRIRWAIKDYPGGWITPEVQQRLKQRGKQEQEKLEKFKEWMNDSKVFIIPIEATLVYEAVEQDHFMIRQQSLHISQTVSMAQEWAKQRTCNNEYGLMMLVPVKCETYFDDNGGKRDDGEKLYHKVVDLYRDVICNVKKEAQNFVEIEYHPVDTYGCVVLDDVEWTVSDKPENKGEFKASYTVRPNQKFSPLGAANLLLSICRHAIKSREGKGYSDQFFLKWFDDQPIFSRELEKVIDNMDCSFKLTQESINNLKKLNIEHKQKPFYKKWLSSKSKIIPEDVISNLERMKNKLYTKQDFTSTLEEAIGKEHKKYLNKYKDIILGKSVKITKKTRVKRIDKDC